MVVEVVVVVVVEVVVVCVGFSVVVIGLVSVLVSGLAVERSIRLDFDLVHHVPYRYI